MIAQDGYDSPRVIPELCRVFLELPELSQGVVGTVQKYALFGALADYGESGQKLGPSTISDEMLNSRLLDFCR